MNRTHPRLGGSSSLLGQKDLIGRGGLDVSAISPLAPPSQITVAPDVRNSTPGEKADSADRNFTSPETRRGPPEFDFRE